MSEHAPLLIDSDVEDAQSLSRDGPDVIDVDSETDLGYYIIDDEADSSSNGNSSRAAHEEPVQNDTILLPDVEVASTRLSDGTCIKVGSTVELKATGEHDFNSLNSGDFLRVKHIIKDMESGEIRLRGYYMARTKYHKPLFENKLNELVMMLRVNEHDDRPALIQGMEDISIQDVAQIRQCLITSKSYNVVNFQHNYYEPWFWRLPEDEQKQIVFHQHQLFCRFVNIEITIGNGKVYGGIVRQVYSHEADAPQSRGTSSGSRASITHNNIKRDGLSDNDDQRPKAPGRERSCSLEELQEIRRTRRPQHPVKIPRYTFADAFCGIGGASSGATQAGLFVKWGLDRDAAAITGFSYNYPEATPLPMNADDLPALEDVKHLKVAILHLSPPCDYWSPNHTREGKNDQENYEALYTVAPIIKKIKPRIATLEQTYGLYTNMTHNKNFRDLVRQISEVGYDVRYKIQDFAELGLPQRRMRLIMIMARRGTPLPPFPKPTHGGPSSGLKRYVSVADALEPLARLGHVDVDYHEPNGMIPRNKEPYNAYNTMVRGCITRSGGDQNYHPSGTRDFTPRELALLQSFLLNYHFKGSNTEARKQIGNAFPPVVAREIFHVIAQTLEAFDHGFINAEDEIHDLDALLAERNINIPAQRTVRPLFGEDAYDPITQSPFRYLAGNRNGADSGQRNRQRRSALFRRARSIEPAEPRIRQQQRRRNLFDLMGSDCDEDESVIYESRKERRARVLREELFVAEAMGNIYSLDDSD